MRRFVDVDLQITERLPADSNDVIFKGLTV